MKTEMLQEMKKMEIKMKMKNLKLFRRKKYVFKICFLVDKNFIYFR